MKSPVKRRLAAALLCAAFLACGAELNAWYYFTASNGLRCQWPSASLPLTVYVDSDYSFSPGIITDGSSGVLDQWNKPFGNSLSIFNTGYSTTAMLLDAVKAYLRSPINRTVWIVHDTDGSILTYLGASKISVYGLGIPLCSSSSPNTIISGIIIMNGYLISSETMYKKVLLHEIGHVLGFAHSVSGGNKNLTVNTSKSMSNWPMMYPYIGTNELLQADDKAGIMAVYGQ